MGHANHVYRAVGSCLSTPRVDAEPPRGPSEGPDARRLMGRSRWDRGSFGSRSRGVTVLPLVRPRVVLRFFLRYTTLRLTPVVTPRFLSTGTRGMGDIRIAATGRFAAACPGQARRPQNHRVTGSPPTPPREHRETARTHNAAPCRTTHAGIRLLSRGSSTSPFVTLCSSDLYGP